MKATSHAIRLPMPDSSDVASGAVVTLSGVSRAFNTAGGPVQALDNVDGIITRGRVTGLIGPDGAGKTTLMRLISGLLVPDTGSVNTLGFDVKEQPLKVQASMCYMPQRFGLYEDLTVQENLDLYADLQQLPYAGRPDRYAELMHMTGLAAFAARLAGQLSGGMKQKLGLACTLVGSPKLLLLDEPTAGVDPVSRRELWEIVYRQVSKTGMSVIFSTAYLDEAERCDEVLLLHQGRLLGQDTPAAFSSRMQGRTWHRSLDEGVSKRALQHRLSQLPGVIDTTIQGEQIRLVMAADTAAPDEANLQATPPRFEDAFIAMLGGADTAAIVSDQQPVHTHTTDNDQLPVIEVSGLTRNFGTFQAVKGIDFSIRRGEVFGLLGANGAGKSTTFRMLCGLLPASHGELTVAGVNLREAPSSARSRIGYMSQRFSLYGSLSVLENMRFFSSAYGLGRQQRKMRIDWACKQFELGEVIATAANDLPLGYKQRLAMACALLHEPDILFLDEPTSGVDPLARREFWHRINLLAEQGVTVLVTTHFMEEAEYCDRLVIMAEGTILAAGTPHDIRMEAAATGRPADTMEDAFITLIHRQPELATA
nr:ATP-binding cassette domain-containing protein [Mariprofundus ferrooxydans]